MIEGNLSDVSLPGLLQFLATESNKCYRVELVNGPQKGDVIVCEGEILAANFGLLEGNDALTEFLFWSEGSFSVERLADRDSAKSSNLNIVLKQVNTFADQMHFLQGINVGLNTEIVPSPTFGTQEWQEELKKQPLYKEDYVVLGWITDGRTMRQAMREFNFDVVQATSSLFRLLSTGSVDSIKLDLQAAEERFELEDKERDQKIELDEKIELNEEIKLEENVAEPLSESREAVAQLEAPLEVAAEVPAEVLVEAPVESSRPEPARKKSAKDTMTIPPVVPALAATAVEERDQEVITSDSLPAVGSPEFMELMSRAQKASSPAADPSHHETPAAAKTEPSEPQESREEEKRSFDIRRTDPLPLVAIDIERLFQTCFHVAPFGQVALNNNALEDDMQKIVSAFKAGKTFINVATDGGHGDHPAQILHTCKYALERGYIDPPDQVVSLTADLLLGRVELEQYLLQRRRINGDELRDVIELARQKSVKLVELLVKMGFMTESDWDRLTREKERFAPR
jgi:hypothetical protein